MRHPDMKFNRKRAIVALQNAEGLTPQMVADVRAFKNDPDVPHAYRAQAQLALGAMMKSDIVSEGLREELTLELHDDLLYAPTEIESRNALRAILNTHDPIFADIVRPYAYSDDRSLYPDGIRALVMIGGLTSHEEAIDLYGSLPDTESAGRLILSSMGGQPKTASTESIGKVEGMLKMNIPSQKRRLLITYLGKLSAHHPAAKQVLIAHFAVETDPENKVLIGQYLSHDELP